MRVGKLARKNAFINICQLKKIQTSLEPYISNPEIAKQYLLAYCIESVVLGIIIILYMISVLIHDISFEKIEKIGKYVADFKK
jgi:hypothetical protein